MACYDLLLEAQETMSRTPRRKQRPTRKKFTIDASPEVAAWVTAQAREAKMPASRWLRITIDLLRLEAETHRLAGQ